MGQVHCAESHSQRQPSKSMYTLEVDGETTRERQMTVHTTNQPADEVLTNALRNDRRPSDTDRQQFRKAKDIESNRGWVARIAALSSIDRKIRVNFRAVECRLRLVDTGVLIVVPRIQ